MAKKPNRSKNVILADAGLLKDSVWKQALQGYSTFLVSSIRKKLLSEIPKIAEKFNTNSRYFGYWTGTDKDRAYIYVQKKGLRIDLCISREFEIDLRKAGYKVGYVNNFQGRAGWLTGWKIPHSTKDLNFIVQWLCAAMKGDFSQDTLIQMQRYVANTATTEYQKGLKRP